MESGLWLTILELLEQNNPKKYFACDDVIVCPDKESAWNLADFFDDLGYYPMHAKYEDNDWIVYPD